MLAAVDDTLVVCLRVALIRLCSWSALVVVVRLPGIAIVNYVRPQIPRNRTRFHLAVFVIVHGSVQGTPMKRSGETSSRLDCSGFHSYLVESDINAIKDAPSQCLTTSLKTAA